MEERSAPERHRARQRRPDGETRDGEGEMLCAFIEQTTLLDPHAKPGPQLAMLAQSIFEAEASAIFDADLDEIYQAGDWFDELEEVLRNVYFFERASDDRETGLIRRVLRMGKLPIGAMLLRGEMSFVTAGAIAAVISITFDRYHSLANESRTEGARRTEQLRTTVLDSLAHDYKTPLTVIEAASSGLAAMGNLTLAQTSLVALIEEQANKLNELTTRLLTTAHLDTSELMPKMERVAVGPLIDDVVASLREQLSNLAMEVTLSSDELSVCCDRSLVEALLTQYVDNVGKYADVGSNVTIEAMQRSNAVVFSVRSHGPVIPAADFERIFDRYYRCSTGVGKAAGTGIGLSIAKHAAQAHGGHVWVTSDAIEGTVFYASVPTTIQGDGI